MTLIMARSSASAAYTKREEEDAAAAEIVRSFDEDNDNSCSSSSPFENTARTFFELGITQRIAIMFKISESKCNLAKLSKDMDSAMPEVRRNIIRLTNS